MKALHLHSESSASIAALARLFSTAAFRELGVRGRSSLVARLLRQSSITTEMSLNSSLASAFAFGFDVLRRQPQRHECIYKAAIVNRRLLGTHSLRTALMLSEVRVGSAIADLVLLNGTSTAFEIKSERDKLAKLRHQVRAYREVFANVCVVLGPDHVGSAMVELPVDVGVYTLDRRLRLSQVRSEVENTSHLSPSTMLSVLRKREVELLLNALGLEVPTGPNTRFMTECREQVIGVAGAKVHSAMIDVLKRTRIQRRSEDYVAALPHALKSLGLEVGFSVGGEQRVLIALQTPLHEVMTWG